MEQLRRQLKMAVRLSTPGLLPSAPYCPSLESSEPSQTVPTASCPLQGQRLWLHGLGGTRGLRYGGGSLRKESGLWEQPQPAAPDGMSMPAQANIRALLSPCEWALEQPGPRSQQGGKRLPGRWHQHPTLRARASSVGCLSGLQRGM